MTDETVQALTQLYRLGLVVIIVAIALEVSGPNTANLVKRGTTIAVAAIALSVVIPLARDGFVWIRDRRARQEVEEP